MPIDPAGRYALNVTSALLEQGRIPHLVSVALTIAAILGVPVLGILAVPHGVFWQALAIFSIGCGIAELCLAMRIAFDAALFAQWTAGSLPDLENFDAAMLRLTLMPPGKAGRALETRCAGALRLLRWQVLALGGQILVIVAGSLVMAMEGPDR